MQRAMRNAASILCAAAASAALSATVDECAVRAAAEAFVTRDAVGSAVLRGTTVKSARERDGLWVVSLAPAGHVILSGSDLADPRSLAFRRTTSRSLFRTRPPTRC